MRKTRRLKTRLDLWRMETGYKWCIRTGSSISSRRLGENWAARSF